MRISKVDIVRYKNEYLLLINPSHNFKLNIVSRNSHFTIIIKKVIFCYNEGEMFLMCGKLKFISFSQERRTISGEKGLLTGYLGNSGQVRCLLHLHCIVQCASPQHKIYDLAHITKGEKIQKIDVIGHRIITNQQAHVMANQIYYIQG